MGDAPLSTAAMERGTAALVLAILASIAALTVLSLSPESHEVAMAEASDSVAAAVALGHPCPCKVKCSCASNYCCKKFAILAKKRQIAKANAKAAAAKKAAAMAKAKPAPAPKSAPPKKVAPADLSSQVPFSILVKRINQMSPEQTKEAYAKMMAKKRASRKAIVTNHKSWSVRKADIIIAQKLATAKLESTAHAAKSAVKHAMRHINH